MNTVRLFWIDVQTKLRSKKIFLVVGSLVLVYGLIFMLNLQGYKEVAKRFESGEVDALYIKIPLHEPIKTYSYFDNFISYRVREDEKVESPIGLLFISDRHEESVSLTRAIRLLFLISACVVISFAYNECTDLKERRLYHSLRIAPIRKRDIFRAKLLLGIVLIISVLVLEIFFVVVLAKLKNLNFQIVQYQQICFFNLINGIMLYLIYCISLAIGVSRKTSSEVFIYSLLGLMVIVYLVPIFWDNLCNYIFFAIPRTWRGTWYWYSRYLMFGNPFGSFGVFASEMLFLEKSRILYASLPLSDSFALLGRLTPGKLFLLNWYQPLSLICWILGIFVITERRLEKRDDT